MNNDSLPAVVGKGETLRPLGNVEAQVQREEEFGVRNSRKLPDPKLPSKEEVERRYLTHLPFQNWCQYCVQGKVTIALPRQSVDFPKSIKVV